MKNKPINTTDHQIKQLQKTIEEKMRNSCKLLSEKAKKIKKYILLS